MIYRNQVASVLFGCLKLMYSIIQKRLSAILAWLNNQNDDVLKDCCKGSISRWFPMIVWDYNIKLRSFQLYVIVSLSAKKT